LIFSENPFFDDGREDNGIFGSAPDAADFTHNTRNACRKFDCVTPVFHDTK